MASRLAELSISSLLITSLVAAPVPAQDDPRPPEDPLAIEAQGLDPHDLDPNLEDPAVAVPRPLPKRTIPEGGLPDFLLVPESTNDAIMSFDPMTGDLIDAAFIPADPDNLSTPIQAILSASGDSILVSDHLDDVVQEYDMSGNFLGTFAPAGGVDNSILDNIRGIALRDNGNLLVTVGSGTNADGIAEFDTSGNYLGNFVANGDGGLDNPFDVLLTTEALVGGIDSDIVHRFNVTTGAYIADLAPINNFPEQIAAAQFSTNLLVANFGGTQEGIVELMSDGTLVGVTDPASLGGYRGVFELGNGNLLVTNGGGVHEIDRMNNLIETKVGGVSARFITLIQDAVPVELIHFSVD